MRVFQHLITWMLIHNDTQRLNAVSCGGIYSSYEALRAARKIEFQAPPHWVP